MITDEQFEDWVLNDLSPNVLSTSTVRQLVFLQSVIAKEISYKLATEKEVQQAVMRLK